MPSTPEVLLASRVLAGAGLDPIDRGAVVVDGTTIAWVGPAAGLPSDYADAPSRDLGGVTLMPGLIDAHVHLAFDGGPTPVARMMAEDDTQQVALMLNSARQLLSVGVTTARDLGARGRTSMVVRDAIADGDARGPRILAAGAAITVTGGHCWFMGAEVDSPDEMRTMVRQLHKDGADWIKVMSTGGNMTPGSAPWHAQFSEAELAIAVDEAHRLGKGVAAHAHGVEGIRRALAAGVDTLEHCSFQTETAMGQVDPDLADAIAASDSYVSPTSSFRTTEFRKLIPGLGLAVGELFRRGAKVIMSTDAGIDNVPHHGFIGGLEALHSNGLPIQEVLLAATSRAATALRLDGVTGHLSEGLDADLIAVSGNPLQDLSALRSLRLVKSRGTDFHPDVLPEIGPLPLDSLPEFLRARMQEAE